MKPSALKPLWFVIALTQPKTLSGGGGGGVGDLPAGGARRVRCRPDLSPGALTFDYVLLSSLELSNVRIYEPSIRAFLGTVSFFC